MSGERCDGSAVCDTCGGSAHQIALVIAELARLEKGARAELDRNPLSDPHFRFEDGVLTAVACIRSVVSP